MKILYCIQGTGNGHLSRARDVVPALQRHGEVDIVVSGIQADVELPFPIKYRFKGISFIFGKNGGVDMLESFRRFKSKRFFEEMRSLPVEDYDIVISDFEPVSAWVCFRKNVECIGLSHQAAVMSDDSPKPEDLDILGNFVLRHYCPVSKEYGFHFKSYNEHIFTPVIRKQIRELKTDDRGHYTVYLPAYDDLHLMKHFGRLDFAQWDIFSKHNKQRVVGENFVIQPISNDVFINSLSTSSGILCGAGFETPAEALFLKKKVLAVPMKGQYEQQCNAAGLLDIGVPILNSLKTKYYDVVESWVKDSDVVNVDYPEITNEIIDWVISSHSKKTDMPFVDFIAKSKI
jgi:uncharacterized protein (TIGR00661 family)